MELNHILIALGVTIVLTIVAHFLTRKKYYKHHTVYLYFETQNTKSDRVVFIKEGYNSPEDLIEEIREQRKEVEKVTGNPAVLKNIKIFKPEWKAK